MKVFVDENIPKVTVSALRELGYDVKDIRQSHLKGISDQEIWELCQREERLLVTTDLGFSHYRHKSHFGMLIVRLKQPNKEKIHSRVLREMKRMQPKEWPGLLVIAQDRFQRIWRS
ncbi:MAG: hypothetical protein A2W61_04270 [Deltaproteobacteria bacterium RIFCSPLOWO2_01_44_7]|nr:MAG: hypothetical protein A2712_03405 [Deltaproteobacteria bacterium RIFCSPHIGHO2_01_FULL_43_49]OGQ16240.1 MAG: hypothetical protein A3D22_01375 [Deltaproteobacteria bacterium RIFCSPHIGHO2_02_FULL_44_53]OGQ29200.1 MAG: hypothetical protein A3D98_05160 [Deltaproteobacteria bacterium RIFCSPHIGHO2_12_FULL_44_21]OGQ32757.1 MAG: hypothetical protein A2979_09305 [Deltaproteobacteria bacterium RIFCSPLOWO2_01_FULL_45_74]OGQ41859.1 MAG: hypothetical protein A3I70_09090 [Deltaproteobacteria bacterium 